MHIQRERERGEGKEKRKRTFGELWHLPMCQLLIRSLNKQPDRSKQGAEIAAEDEG